MSSDQLNIRFAKIAIGIACALAIAAQYVFYGAWLGVNAPLFILLFILGAGGYSMARGKRFSVGMVYMLAALVFFSGMIFFRANGFLTFLNCLASVYLLAFLADELAESRAKELLIEYVMPFVILPLVFVQRGGMVLREAFASRATSSPATTRTGKVMKGVLMALPVVIVLSMLFASADQIFADALKRLFFFPIDQHLIARVLIVLIGTWVFAGALYYATGQSAVKSSVLLAKKDPRKIGMLEMGVFLGMINAVFAVFICIQVSYFFGGAEKFADLGISYASYARRGFGELGVIGIIAFFVMWFSGKAIGQSDVSSVAAVVKRWWQWMRHRTIQYPLSFRFLCTILSVQVFLVLLSAFQRLLLYEQAYGFTRPRFFAYVFFVFFAVLFVLFVVKFWLGKSDASFLKTAFWCAVCTLAVVNILNPDAYIARKNIERYRVSGIIDEWYLTQLSSDAVPVVFPFWNENVFPDLNEPYRSPEIRKSMMGQGLYARWMERFDDPKFSDWRSAHMSRTRAKQVFAQYQNALAAYADYTPPMLDVLRENYTQSLFSRLESLALSGEGMHEIPDPGLGLLTYIHPAQLQNFFQIGTLRFALALRPSLNIPLDNIPSDFTPAFSGILIAEESEGVWSVFSEIRDTNQERSSKNNPYYLWMKENTLFLSVVDQNGAGSGEGVMKVFRFTRTGWVLEKCYYYTDPLKTNTSDYFSYTSQEMLQQPLGLEECTGSVTMDVNSRYY